MSALLWFAAGVLTATVVVEVRDVLLTRRAVINEGNRVAWSTPTPTFPAEGPTAVANGLWLVGGTDAAEQAQGVL